jgi:hypothetical protein
MIERTFKMMSLDYKNQYTAMILKAQQEPKENIITKIKNILKGN